MNTERRLTIAVDGPGSSGKGTVARRVAQALGYAYVDTGAMYRSVALVASERGIDLDDARSVAAVARGLAFDFGWDGAALTVTVDGRDVSAAIRADVVGAGASRVSRHPEVRDALLGLQRALGAGGGVVMDGRDIGTVVLPTADLKIFLDADLGERARRRHAELAARGAPETFDEVRSALEARDRQDRERPVAPLRAADDAVIVDTTGATVEEVVARVLGCAAERRGPV